MAGTTDDILVSAPFHGPPERPATGGAWLFRKEGARWQQAAGELLGPKPDSTYFGWGLALDQDRALISYGLETDLEGNVERVGLSTYRLQERGLWKEADVPLPETPDEVGVVLAFRPPWLATADPAASYDGASQAGRVHLFREEPGDWRYRGDILPPETIAGAAFGYSIELADSHLWIGAPNYPRGEGGGMAFRHPYPK